jgi:toxin YoeB
MLKAWSDEAWDDYAYWQTQDRKTIKKINALIKDIDRNGAAVGIGKPERLKYIDAWSREIDGFNRLMYDVIDSQMFIYSCRGHYEDK